KGIVPGPRSVTSFFNPIRAAKRYNPGLKGDRMRVIRLAIVFVFSTAILWAQATSQIQGIVQDTSGAVIPGIEVKATQTDTGISRMAISSEDGRYVLPNLPIGPYRLEVSAPGFSPFVQTGIVLQVASI